MVQIELNRKSVKLSERKVGTEDHMLFLLEFIGTGKCPIVKFLNRLFDFISSLTVWENLLLIYVICASVKL